jgi:hypothetical protein
MPPRYAKDLVVETIVPFSHHGSSVKYQLQGWFLSIIASLIAMSKSKHLDILYSSAPLLLRGILFIAKTAFSISKTRVVKSNDINTGKNGNANIKQYYLQIKNETRLCFIGYPSEQLSLEYHISSNMKFHVGLAILQNVSRKMKSSQISITATIKNKNDKVQDNILFSIPVKGQSTNIFNYPGGNWIDVSYDLSKYEGKTINICLSAEFEKDGTRITPACVPCIAWGNPRVIQEKNRGDSRKIIILSFESMTDWQYYKSKYPSKNETPALDKLMQQSTVYSRGYSQGDSTLSSVGTILSGLFPTQHGIIDYHSHGDTINKNVKTIPEILSSNKFSTYAVTEVGRMESYRWGRGFDSYLNVPWRSDMEPDVGYIIRLLDDIKNRDGFVFAHLDWLHAPTVRFNSQRTPRTYPVELLSVLSKDEISSEMYCEQMKYIDFQIGQLTSYLKETNQFDNTLMIITGDHGNDLPPWGKHGEYALYEERIRIPLIVKYPVGSDEYISKIIEDPINVSTEIFPKVLSTYDIKTPGDGSQYYRQRLKYTGYAFSETVGHPHESDYVVSMASKEYKYVMFAKINWKAYSLDVIKNEYLFPIIANTGEADEVENIISINIDIGKKMRDLCSDFATENLKYLQENPIGNIYKSEIK